MRMYTMEELLWKDILGSPVGTAAPTSPLAVPPAPLDVPDVDEGMVTTPMVLLSMPSNVLPPRLAPVPPLLASPVAQPAPRPSLAPLRSAPGAPALPRPSMAPNAAPLPVPAVRVGCVVPCNRTVWLTTHRQELTVEDMLRACRQERVVTMDEFIGRRYAHGWERTGRRRAG
jgi:hypothetical protein